MNVQLIMNALTVISQQSVGASPPGCSSTVLQWDGNVQGLHKELSPGAFACLSLTKERRKVCKERRGEPKEKQN